MLTRREFLKLVSAAGIGLSLPASLLARIPDEARAAILQAIPGGTLDPTDIPKYQMPLVVPPAMPLSARGKVDYYEIAVRQFSQQILPAAMPQTTVWSYGSINHPGTVAEGGTFHYPAFTIEAKWNRPVRVKWINDLVDISGNYLPHLLAVDQTLHWANPPGGEAGRDLRPDFGSTPGPYTGPVPIVTHVHGAHTHEESDGYAEAWYLPAAKNTPAGYATAGSFYEEFAQKFAGRYGESWTSGSATFQYPNDQRATTLWYHDHTLGMTRLNVYAGPAGFYLIRGGPDDIPGRVFPGPGPTEGSDPFGTHYEMPIAIQDRSFNADGSLFYPDSREFFDGITQYIPASEIAPIWNPEFFGNAMVVNGRTWPFLNVEQRRYRFRFLNGCNSRFLILKMANSLKFWQIGAEGGFLPEPVELDTLVMGPAERADVIVDFSIVPVGTEIVLLNLGPDEPFGGGVPGVDFDVSDRETTGQVMQFRVVAATRPDTGVRPEKLPLPKIASLGVPAVTRRLSLNEVMDHELDGPVEALLGTVDGGIPVAMKWMDPISENPEVGAIEEWEFYNFTADAHPMHIHLVQFQVINRQALKTEGEGDEEEVVQPIELEGDPRPPEPWETGFKDTVIAYPAEVTRVRARFDLPGLFVWHCHIVEHEDNEMMRPYRVGP